jgi:hypothetical protein
MKLGPLTAEEATLDTNRLAKEGFVVIRVEGAEAESVWNFLFHSEVEALSFEKSLDEIAVLDPDGRIEDEVIELVALNYQAVRYTFLSTFDAQRCRYTIPSQ